MNSVDRSSTMWDDLAKNQSLTFAAKGLYLSLATFEPGTITINRVVETTTSGIYSVRRIFHELEAAGYLSRTHGRAANGQVSFNWTLHERPVTGQGSGEVEAKAS